MTHPYLFCVYLNISHTPSRTFHSISTIGTLLHKNLKGGHNLLSVRSSFQITKWRGGCEVEMVEILFEIILLTSDVTISVLCVSFCVGEFNKEIIGNCCFPFLSTDSWILPLPFILCYPQNFSTGVNFNPIFFNWIFFSLVWLPEIEMPWAI